MGATQLQAGIGIDFDQPRLEVFVNHKVQAEQFEVIGSAGWVKDGVSSLYSLSCEVFHAGQYLLKKISFAGVCSL